MRNYYILLTVVFVIIPIISAEVTYDTCCSLSSDGDVCVSVEDRNQCAGDFANSDCLVTSFCQTGCCYDEQREIASKNVLAEHCEYTWTPDPFCSNVPTSNEGCCILGDEKLFLSEARCDFLGSQYGTQAEWRTDISELECTFIETPQNEGACVLDGGNCYHNRFEECQVLQGTFNEGLLCTALELGTICVPSTDTTCVEEKDGVYFLDSCGNTANIYDATKTQDPEYWRIPIHEENACGTDDVNGNANSPTCGNCNRFKGSFCEQHDIGELVADHGDFFCKSTDCVYEGESYKNGESWCIYDGKIGNGDDVVGSRHFKLFCEYGEVKTEACADYRNEICIQKDVTDDVSGFEVSSAVCKQNRWRECVEYNEDLQGGGREKERAKENCIENDDCMMKRVVDEGINIEVCVPKYPGGNAFEERDGASAKEAGDVCEYASNKCTMVFRRSSPFSSYKCVKNCGCRTQGFLDEMNNICRSLGDCGASVNIAGELSEGGYYKEGEGPRHISGEMKDYLMSLVDQPGDPELEEIVVTFPVITIEDELSLEQVYKKGHRGLFTFIRDEKGTKLTFIGGSGDANSVHASSYILSLFMGGGLGFIDHALGGGVLEAIGWTNTKKEHVDFTCDLWDQPSGGENCELCNEDPLKPCSEYRCSSLGADCILENRGTEDELCTWDNPFDDEAPRIDPECEDSRDIECTNESNTGFTITPPGGGCFDPYQRVEFALHTSEPAKCRYSFIETEDLNMIPVSDAFTQTHRINFLLEDPSHGQSRGINITDKTEVFIQCQDRNGNQNFNFYNVNLCVHEGPDNRAPRINAFDPENGARIGFNVSKQAVALYTNEPATCRWDVVDTNYNNMKGTILCANDLGDSRPLGYPCLTILNVTEDSQTFYFRCEDQPWLEEILIEGENKSDERNENVESTEYSLQRLESLIQIDEISPSEDYHAPTLTSTFDIEVETSGGGDNHICSYSRHGYGSLVRMLETGRKGPHFQPDVTNFVPGDHTIYVECMDETNTRVRKESNFTITHGIDVVTSQIARVWQEQGIINVITTENVECRYTETSCEDSWENATSIGTGVFHDISAIPGETYFIKCADTAGTPPRGCSIKIQST